MVSSIDPGIRSPTGSSIGKFGVGDGDVELEAEPLVGGVVRGPLDAAAPAGTARLGGAGVADEDELGVELELEQRDRGVEALDRRGAHAEVDALGAHQRIDASGRIAGDRIDADGGAARVVGVEAVAQVEVDLGVVPGTEHERELGRQQLVVASPELASSSLSTLADQKSTRRPRDGAEPVVPATRRSRSRARRRSARRRPCAR